MSLSGHVAGLDSGALERLKGTIERDVEEERYDGAVVIVARSGEIGLHEAIGFAHRASGRQVRTDDVFRLLSVTKAFTNVLALAAVDRGLLSLTTRVVEVIPEFRGTDRFRGLHKERLTVVHLLTHRGALMPTPTPVPYERLHDLSATLAAIYELDLIGVPGETVNYSPALAHALLAEMERRVFGAGSFRELLQRELLAPLGLSSTALGAPRAWEERLVPLVAAFPPGGWLGPEDIEIMNTVISEEAELPWVGAVSSAEDLFRFAEMLRRRGELDGTRVLSPAILELATTNQTGELPNDLYAALFATMGWEVPPAYFGLGFALHGHGIHNSFFGTLSSPRTFGNFGAGSTLFWVDPERDVTFVCLTAGVMEEAANVLRFHRLSDLASAAAI